MGGVARELLTLIQDLVINLKLNMIMVLSNMDIAMKIILTSQCQSIITKLTTTCTRESSRNHQQLTEEANSNKCVNRKLIFYDVSVRSNSFLLNYQHLNDTDWKPRGLFPNCLDLDENNSLVFLKIQFSKTHSLKAI